MAEMCHKCGFKLDHSGKHVIGSPYGTLISEVCPMSSRESAVLVQDALLRLNNLKNPGRIGSDSRERTK